MPRPPAPTAAASEAATAGRRSRLDAELVRRRLAASRTDAQRLIADRRVTVRGVPAVKAARQVAPEDPITVSDAAPRWASRGGRKLDGALDRLGVTVEGLTCLDAGASTGGFTDVLLARGAARVVAVDVGYGQLAWRLRTDPRVVVLDRTNVRHLRAEQLPGPAPDLVVADLSFISLRLVLPPLVRAAAPQAELILLVKPQFEAGRDAVGRGGVVRDPQAWASSMRGVASTAADLGLGTRGACASPLPGPAGNVEFFLHLAPGAAGDAHDAIDAAVEEGRRLAGGTG